VSSLYDSVRSVEVLGGVNNLVEWARCNETKFYKMLARIMPREIYTNVNAKLSLVECLREKEDRKGEHEE
jgi:hypothetical protein